MTTQTIDPDLPCPDDPAEVLRLGLRLAQEGGGGPAALSCSFSAEDVVLIGMLRELALPARVFALDTGRLPEETYQVAEALRDLGVEIAWYAPEPLSVEALLRHGPFSFRAGLAERHACCEARKVAPLARALRGAACWITGQRREHGVTRADLRPIERDEAHGGILKLNPLWRWRQDEVFAWARARGLPLHPLYAAGYASIGCAPCTRAVAPGESQRAGRWWWEDPAHKECGLHRRHP